MFDFKTYKNDFSKSLLWWCFAIYGCFLLFSIPLCKVINTVIVDPVLSQCPRNSYFVDIFFIALFIIALVYAYMRFKKGLSISLKSLTIYLITTIIYFQFFRFNNNYDYYKFNVCHCIAYTDCFGVSVYLLLGTYKSFKKPKKIPQTSLSLIEDSPNSDYEDKYGRNEYAEKVAAHIEATSTTSSFAIGIIGEWGSGKTDFLLRLKKKLKEKADNIILDFNPWRSNKSEAIVEDFFKSLSEKLRPFNMSIVAKIKEYSKRILQPGKEIEYRFFDTLISELSPDETLKQKYDSINMGIQSTGKRIIIFIDDLDRLTGKEIMEVLRIIRNTANFGNTFFISGIDQKYVVNTLKNTKEFSNEEEYLRKVFQLVITLPVFKKQIFGDQLKEMLITNDLMEEDARKIQGVISQLTVNYFDPVVAFYPAILHEDIIEKMIDNLRDLKRFCNSFKISFNILKNETDIYDLFVLELIRNRNIEIYNCIRNRRLLHFNSEHTDVFILKDESWKEMEAEFKKHGVGGEEIKNLKSAVEYLLSDQKYKNQRKFRLVHNFYLYFSYQLFNLVSFHEFNNIINSEADAITAKFQQWSQEQKQTELFRIVGDWADFPDSEFLYKIVIAYLNVPSNHDIWMRFVQKLIFYYRKGNHERYFNNNIELHRRFLLKIMAEKAVSLFDRAFIASTFLQDIISKDNKNDTYILSKKEWQKIVYRLFHSYLEKLVEFDQTSLNFLYLNDDKRIDDIVILYMPACRLLKKTLIANRNLMKGYLKLLFRPSQFPYGGYIVFEPWILQIFSDWDTFNSQVEKIKNEDVEYQQLAEIILKYSGNLLPFKIADSKEKAYIEEVMRVNGMIK